MLKLSEMRESCRVVPKMKMVTLHHTKHKPLSSIASPLISEVGGVPTCTSDEDEDDECKKCNTIPNGSPSS